MKHAWRYARWPIGVLLIAYAILVVWRIPAVGEKERTAETIQFIQSRELTLADARGDNLPPAPDPVLADATIEGIDANNNYIRDDVELAIFEKYPNDLKLRAALLQYAMAIQMYLSDVFNDETLASVAKMEERASKCLSTQFPQTDAQQLFKIRSDTKKYIKNLVVNTPTRQQKANDNTRLISSFGSLEGEECDLNR